MRKWPVPITGILLSLSGGGSAATQATPAGPPGGLDQVIGSCMSPADVQRSWDDTPPALRHQLLVCLTAAAARLLNAQLPRQLDAFVRLDQVTASGTDLGHHFTLGRLAADLPSDIAGTLERDTRAQVCAQPNMVRTMQRGGSYSYRWSDSAGQLIHQVRITGC